MKWKQALVYLWDSMGKILLYIAMMVSIVCFTNCTHPSQRSQKNKARTKMKLASNTIHSLQHRPNIQEDNSEICYEDTITCNEETTSGMIEWTNRQREVYETTAKNFEHKLLACRFFPTTLKTHDKIRFQKSIADEIAYWKELEELLRHFNSIVTDIQKIQNGGGSIYGIICADNQRELSYIRYACLLEDLAVLNTTSPQKSSLKDNLCIDSLYIEMKKCRPSVLAHAIRENEDLSEHDAASRAKYLNEAYSLPVVKRDIENWLNARAQVANLLPPNYGIAYNNHTIRTLRSLIYLYRGMEQGV